MTVGLDTSVVLRLITGEPQPLALVALDVVQELLRGKDPVIVSDLVASETYFALQHHFGMPKSAALDVLLRFFRTSGIAPGGVAGDVLATPRLATARPGFVDRMIHAEYMAAAASMLTFEKTAARLPHVRVLAR